MTFFAVGFIVGVGFGVIYMEAFRQLRERDAKGSEG